MISKSTFLSTSDKTNLKWLKVFHLYKGFKRLSTKESFFIKGSAKKVKPPKIEYKGFKRKSIFKGDVCRGLIVKSVFKNSICGYSSTNFYANSIIVIKKKNITFSKYFFGIASTNLQRKKFKILFNKNF
jgi:ribosomal protein L14